MRVFGAGRVWIGGRLDEPGWLSLGFRPAGEAGHVGGGDLKGAQQRGGVVGHGGHRERSGGQRRASRPAVVEGGEPVAAGEPLQLELPGLGGIAQPGDEQDVWPCSPALDPHVQVARADILAHLSALLWPAMPALHVPAKLAGVQFPARHPVAAGWMSG